MSSLHFHQSLGKIQSHTGSGSIANEAGRASEETVKDVWQIGSWNAWPIVQHRDLHVIGFFHATNEDLAVDGGKPDRIGK